MFKQLTLILTACFIACLCINVCASSISVAFSPDGGAEELILHGIEVAEKSIKVAAYSFTSSTVSIALLDAHNRGVNVQVLVDAKSAGGRYSAATFLANKGVQVRLNGKYAIFHNKFMVIDDKHLETGSFNYSSAAAHRNAENVIVLWDNSEVAKIYTDEWLELWNEGEQLLPAY